MYRLHGFCQSGNTFKVAFLLRALGQPWQPAYVNYMVGITSKDEWREDINEMGECPVLDDGDRRLTQSGVILSYLSDKHRAYAGTSEMERLEVLRWLLFDNHKFTSYFASYRFMKAFGLSEPDQAVMRWLEGRIDNAFRIVNKHLSDQTFLVGNAPTIADFSLCGYLFYPKEESGFDFTHQYPNISEWLKRLRTIPGWADPYDILPGEFIPPRR